jgi:hypothetical protein
VTLLRKIADALAVILHPVFLFFYAFLGYWIFTSEISHGMRSFFIVLVLTVAIPIAAVYFLAGDIHLSNRKSRFLPLGIALVGYIAALILLGKLGDLEELLRLLLQTVILSTVLILVLNTFLKVSMHANAYGITMFMLMLLWFQQNEHPLRKALIILAFILMLFVLWQRLASGAHKLGEVVLGLITGVISCITILLLYLMLNPF